MRVAVSFSSEVKAIAQKAAHGCNQLAQVVFSTYRQRQLDKQTWSAQVELGSAMVDRKVGNERFRQQISELEDRIKTISAANGSGVPALQTEISGLKVRLASSVTSATCPPAIAGAYARYRQQRDKSDSYRAQVAESRKHLVGLSKRTSVRIAAGAFTFLLLALWIPHLLSKPVQEHKEHSHVSSLVISSMDNEAGLKNCIGMVVCGVHVSNDVGNHKELRLSTGSCFAITPDGYLLTNKHVVEENTESADAKALLAKLREKKLNVKPSVWVLFGKEKYVANVKYTSPRFDLAILKIERTNCPWMRLKLGTVSRGKSVYALGFPGAAAAPLSPDEAVKEVARLEHAENVEDSFKIRDLEFTQTNGTISRLATEENGIDWLQHNASINPGNSGGPLVMEDASVIGINSLTNSKASGVFFALALPQLRDEILRIVPELSDSLPTSK